MELKKAILIIFISVFCVSVIFNCYLSFEIIKFSNQYSQIEQGNKFLAFRDMFVKNVLLSSTEIDFDTRLDMENTVRDLNDQEVLSQWQAFTKSTTQEDASFQAKKLLRLLIKRTAR